MKNSRHEYGKEMIMRGGVLGGAMLVGIAVDSPVPVGEFSAAGQAVLKDFIARAVAEDVEASRHQTLDKGEATFLVGAIDRMLTTPVSKPQTK